tara:strand:+ start:467 stop:691 length:225 start_codon:yes stop_codon:yes gene_type:complete
MSIKETEVCYNCGVVRPEYTVVGLSKDCNECDGIATVVEVGELINMVNDLLSDTKDMQDLAYQDFLTHYLEDGL